MTDHFDDFAGLLEAAQSGDERAWSVLYDSVAGALVAYLRLRGASDPEALVGDSFVQIARHLHRFEGDAAGFRSWAFMIAHHRLVDDRRRKRRRPLVSGELEGEVLAETDGQDVEELALSALEGDRIEKMLEPLSTDQRNVVLLRILGGLSAAETAKAMGKTEGAVRVLQHRAIKTLREAVSPGGVTQ